MAPTRDFAFKLYHRDRIEKMQSSQKLFTYLYHTVESNPDDEAFIKLLKKVFLTLGKSELSRQIGNDKRNSVCVKYVIGSTPQLDYKFTALGKQKVQVIVYARSSVKEEDRSELLHIMMQILVKSIVECQIGMDKATLHEQFQEFLWRENETSLLELYLNRNKKIDGSPTMPGMMGTSVVQNGPTSYHQNGPQPSQQPQVYPPVTSPALQNDSEEIFTAGGNQTFTDAPARLAAEAPIENTGVSMGEPTSQVSGQQLPGASGALVPGNQSGEQFQCPRRPSHEVNGRANLLRANHFAVRIPGGTIQHYQVDVSPDQRSRRVNREIINCMIHSFSKYFNNCRPVYDGKRNMYTRDRLPIERVQKVFDVMLPGDSAVERQFSVSLKWLGQVSLSVLEDAMEGTDQQIPFEAIDDSATALYRSMPVIEFISEVLELPVQALAERRGLSDAQRVTLLQVMRGLKVEITHSGPVPQEYRVWKISGRPAQTQTFSLQLETGQTIECTVAKYFYDKYRIQLKYPHLQCLVVGQNTYLPLEVCNIVPGQRCIKKLTAVQTSTSSQQVSGEPQYMPGMMGTSVVQNGPTSYHQNGPQPSQQPQVYPPETAPALQNDFEEISTAGGNQILTDAPAFLAAEAPIENTGVSMGEPTSQVSGMCLDVSPIKCPDRFTPAQWNWINEIYYEMKDKPQTMSQEACNKLIDKICEEAESRPLSATAPSSTAAASSSNVYRKPKITIKKAKATNARPAWR